MQILIYDKNREDLEYLTDLLRNIPIDFHFDKCFDHISFLDKFKENNYDILFIDSSNKDGEDLIKYLKEHFPSQKVININNSFICFEKNGCEYCKENFNHIRLIKPLRMEELANVIKKDKRCENDIFDDPLKSKLFILSKPYKTYKLNINDLVLNEVNNSSVKMIEDKINIVNQLSTHDIEFEIQENYIQVIA